MNITELMNELNAQSKIIKEKNAQIEQIQNDAKVKLQELQTQIKEAYDIWYSLAWQPTNVKEKRNADISQVGIASLQQKAIRAIKQFKKQIVISNDDLAQLLTKRTGKKWNAKIVLVNGIDRESICEGKVKNTSLILESEGTGKQLNSIDNAIIKEICDIKTKEPIDMSGLDYAIVAHSRYYSNDSHIKDIKKINWVETYLIKKIIGHYHQTNFDFYELYRYENDEIPNNEFGDLMYSVIDEYVQNLVAGNSATKKPIASKK